MHKKLLTQKELAKQANLTEGTVSRLMRTKTSSYETLVKIATVLEVQPVDLFRQMEVS